MEKKFCALVFTLTFVALSSVVHSSPTIIYRSPSVAPVVEVDIEDAKAPSNSGGYNFENNSASVEPATTFTPKSRVPANIVTKSDVTTPSSMIGPLIFLIALPIGLWIVISKKLNKSEIEKTVDYYPKTHQFNPYKTDYQKSAEDEDDIDYPKAS